MINSLSCVLGCRTRLRIVKKKKAPNFNVLNPRSINPSQNNNNNSSNCWNQPLYNLNVAETEDLVFHNIPNDSNLKQQLFEHIENATRIAEKKTSKDRNNHTAMKQDAFINVNTFLGGLLLFGLTGRKSNGIVPDRIVLELQLLSFFIFLGAIMSSLMFMLFVKFHDWKKYKPYQDALIKIKRKAELVWWKVENKRENNNKQDANGVDTNHDGVSHDLYYVDDNDYRTHHGGLLYNEWNLYQQYQSITHTKKKSQCDYLAIQRNSPQRVAYDNDDVFNNNDDDDIICANNVIEESCSKQEKDDEVAKEFSQWTKEILEIAAREESKARETLRRWSVILPFTLTCIGMVLLCVVVFMGADVQLHTETRKSHQSDHLELWIYVVAPLSLIVPFCMTLSLIRYYTGRLHDLFEW